MSFSLNRIFVTIVGTFVGLCVQTLPLRAEQDSTCPRNLKLVSTAVDPYFSTRFEKHSLYDLLTDDPTKNLAVLHPSIVQSAAERLMSWINWKPSRFVANPLYGVGSTEYFPVFGDGLSEAGGKMIIGQVEAIATVVSYVRAAARGDGAAVKQPLLTGPGGTGKSEFLSILARIASNLTTTNPDYYLYTYRWVNLNEIAELRKYYEVQVGADGKELPLNIDAAVARSPVTLLPASIQQRVMALARDRAIALSGYEPRPLLNPDSQSTMIKRAIVDHYRQREPYKGRAITEEDVVEMLSRHVEVIRRPMDGPGAFPTLSVVGNDVPFNEIFFAQNPMNFSIHGPQSPFSYHLTGTIMRADGGIFLTDEWWRQRPELRDTFLDVIEDRTVQRGGSPREDLDVFIIGAGNDESLEEAKSKGAVKAQVDRAASIPMRLSINPTEIQATMLLMKNPTTLRMRRLDTPVRSISPLQPATEPVVAEPQNVWEKVEMRKLFPVPDVGNPQALGLNRRYALQAITSPRAAPVFIAPHTLEVISYVVASTRFVVDRKLAASLGNYGVVSSALFSDITARLKAITGETPARPDEARELLTLHHLLKEGSKGLTTRDAANVWLHKLIEVASTNPEYHNTITPSLALSELWDLLEKGKITYPDEATRLQWLRNSIVIGKNFGLRWIEQDVLEASSSDTDAAQGVYDEVKLELIARSENSEARDYKNSTGRLTLIKTERLDKIKAKYREQTGRNLEPSEVINFHAQFGAEAGRRHSGLVNAINAVLAEMAANAVDWEAFANHARTGGGGHATQTRFAAMQSYMVHRLGYNPASVLMAVEFRAQLDHLRSQLSELERRK